MWFKPQTECAGFWSCINSYQTGNSAVKVCKVRAVLSILPAYETIKQTNINLTNFK